MKNLKSLVLITTLATTICLPLFAQDAENLFPEGAFEMTLGNGVPEGWGIPDKNDKPWQAGNVVTMESEEGGTFARIKTTEAFPGFYALSAAIPIPVGKSTIRVSARMRAQMEVVPGSWNGYKVHVGFAKTAGPGPGMKGFDVIDDKMAFSLQKPAPEWTEMESTIDVPMGAAFVIIKVLVGSMIGTFDLDDVKVFAE